MPAWPASLPKPFAGAYSEERQEALLRSQMENGAAKVRRRFTAVPVIINHQMLLTAAEVTTLETFYITTCKAGALSFDYTHPRKSTTVTARFVGAYDLRAQGALYNVTCRIEVLP